MPDHCVALLWEYYTAAAKELGLERHADGRPATDASYSLRWYFADHDPAYNTLTQAFLGDAQALARVRRAILGQAGAADLNALYDGRGSAQYNEDDFLEGSPQPDEAQREAIRAALALPVSFIKGPPGSGKTSAILHLLSCIVQQGKTAAMISSNNAAIDSIVEKVEQYTDGRLPKQHALNKGFARLGNRARRRAFKRDHPEMFTKEHPTCDKTPAADFLAARPIVASTIHSLPKCFADWDQGQDGARQEPRYDYVIVDESSQVNPLLGLIALGSARHLVLVGDDDQLPPVVDEERAQNGTGPQAEAAKAELGEAFDRIYALSEERSFLGACREAFLAGRADLTSRCDRMLRFHYRCHPGIISFCRDEVYGGKLEIRTRQYDHTHAMPIRVLWFEGNYCEPYPRQDAGQDGAPRRPGSKRNRRQVEIFFAEEWPALLDRLCADPGTVLDLSDPGPLSMCVLSPFRGQLWELQERLNAWLADAANQAAVQEKAAAHRQALLDTLLAAGVQAWLDREDRAALREEVRGMPDMQAAAHIVERYIKTLPERLRPTVVGDDKPADPLDIQVPELTVHKAQGKEYDIVYFLPVEDKNWEWPWSQKKRLINVAVSRAKKELRIIVSTALMDRDIQQALTGRAVEPWVRDPCGPGGDTASEAVPEKGKAEDNAFLQKLIRYVWEKGPRSNAAAAAGPWTDGEFGFHRAPFRSLFDRVVYVARDRAYSKSFPFAPEICLQDWLCTLPLAVENRLSLYIDARIDAVVPAPEGLAGELKDYIGGGAHFDCVICQDERLLLVIEVDGPHHRTERKNQKRDEKKDLLVKTGFGAAMYTAVGGALRHVEGSADPAASSFAFVRLPTDGSAWNEPFLLSELLRERLAMPNEPAFRMAVRDLEGLPAHRRGYVYRVLTWKQNWETGRPLEKGETCRDPRWVPTERGAWRGLMLAYLPREGKGDRLYPTLRCQSSAWDALCGTKKQ